MSHTCPGCWSTSILDNRVVCHQCFLLLSRADRETLRERLAGTAEQFFAAERILDKLPARAPVALDS